MLRVSRGDALLRSNGEAVTLEDGNEDFEVEVLDGR